ncbi:Serine carboxypeptidase-like 19 [Hordeum vulgare]|nr:Serine carboxypeptidase-like 19 [Hordeum vulgare]
MAPHSDDALAPHSDNAQGKTLDLDLSDRTMVAPSMPLSLRGLRFGANVVRTGQVKERCRIHRKADGGSRWHGAVEVWQRARVSGYVQDGGVVSRHGDVDDGPGKVDESVPALEMDRRKMAVTSFESAPD